MFYISFREHGKEKERRLLARFYHQIRLTHGISYHSSKENNHSFPCRAHLQRNLTMLYLCLCLCLFH